MHCLKSSAGGETMHLLFFFLALVAAGFVIALVVGVTLELIGLLFMALLVVLGVSWVMRKIRGPSSRGVRALDAEREERLRR
jgi:hypothetical protein